MQTPQVHAAVLPPYGESSSRRERMRLPDREVHRAACLRRTLAQGDAVDASVCVRTALLRSEERTTQLVGDVAQTEGIDELLLSFVHLLEEAAQGNDALLVLRQHVTVEKG